MQSRLSHQNNKLLLISHLYSEQQMVHSVLSSHGYHVHKAAVGYEGLRLFFQVKPDLILCDVNLPDVSVADLYRRVRYFSDVPIVVLGDPKLNQQNDTCVVCASAPYLAKPLQPAALLTQVQQALHWSEPQQSHVTDETGQVSSATELILDHRQYQVYLCGKANQLNATEYRLLVYFIQNAGRILTHVQVLDELWGDTKCAQVNYLHTLVWRLRRKIEQNPKAPQHLLSHYGVGYSFEGPTVQIR